MSQEEIRGVVMNALRSVAPEADPEALDPRADIRDALDIDSMDFLRFVVAVHEALRVDIPEADYPKVRTLEGCLAYLDERTLKGKSP
jgi:acyl carrier protein